MIKDKLETCDKDEKHENPKELFVIHLKLLRLKTYFLIFTFCSFFEDILPKYKKVKNSFLSLKFEVLMSHLRLSTQAYIPHTIYLFPVYIEIYFV